MYRSAGNFLRRNEKMKKLHWLGALSRKLRTSNERFYHSENGVYGYREKKTSTYDGALQNKFHGFFRFHFFSPNFVLFFNVFAVPQENLSSRAKYSNFYRLVTAYREHAHKQANIDPVSTKKRNLVPELDRRLYGLDLKEIVSFDGILATGKSEGTVEEAIDILNSIYSGNIGAEFSYLEVKENRVCYVNFLRANYAKKLN